MHPTKLLPSLALISAAILIAGCQKEIREVRRTEPSKYTVDTGPYAVSGGRYHTQTITGTQSGARYDSGFKLGTPSGASYDSGFKLGTPSAPRLAPVGVGIPAQTTEHD
jgi:hypothetical protein